MNKLSLTVTVSAIALAACNTTGTTQFLEANSGTIITTTCLAAQVADGYFQQHVQAGKIGPKTATAERATMIALRAVCANPPIGPDGKPDIVKALALIQPIYQSIQDMTKAGAP